MLADEHAPLRSRTGLRRLRDIVSSPRLTRQRGRDKLPRAYASKPTHSSLPTPPPKGLLLQAAGTELTSPSILSRRMTGPCRLTRTPTPRYQVGPENCASGMTAAKGHGARSPLHHRRRHRSSHGLSLTTSSPCRPTVRSVPATVHFSHPALRQAGFTVALLLHRNSVAVQLKQQCTGALPQRME